MNFLPRFVNFGNKNEKMSHFKDFIFLKRTIAFGGLFIIFCFLDASAQDSKKDYADFENSLGLFKEEKFKEAIDLLTQLINRPHITKLDEDLFFYRGQAYYHVGEFDKSIDDLKKSQSLNHYNKGTINWYLGLCNQAKGNNQEALQLLDEAVTLTARNKKLQVRIMEDRSLLKSKMGQSDEGATNLPIAKDTENEKIDRTAPPVSQGNQINQVVVNKVPKEKTSEEIQQSIPKKDLVPTLKEIYKDEKRYALVIGNSNYVQEIGSLKNPANDATDMAEELRNSDFEVQLLLNATYVQIREAVRKFHEKLINGPRDQTIGLFYYAGHGIQFQDENYLVPVDAKVQFEDDIVRMCFPVQRMILANMERSNSRMNIVILDACRNNPFPATTRSVNQGLAEMKKARGSFIAYATAPGSVAQDGNGRNGLYTQELLKAVRNPGFTIEKVFKEVRQNVLKLSGEQQYTWDSSNIVGDFYFKLE